MFSGVSPQRPAAEPLLDQEEQAQAQQAGSGGASNSTGGAAGALDRHDLNLTESMTTTTTTTEVAGGGGETITSTTTTASYPNNSASTSFYDAATGGAAGGNVYGEDNDVDIDLPPLTSYCTYVKYAWSFGKYVILAIIVNVVTFVIASKKWYYFDYRNLLPFDDVFRGFLLCGVWIVTSIWSFSIAKYIERDVHGIDLLNQYEIQVDVNEATTTTGAAGGGGGGGSGESSSFVPNFDHSYGQVSRMIDRRLIGGGGSTPRQTTTNELPSVSTLVNLAYVIWSILLSAGIFMGVGTGTGEMFYSGTSCHNVDGLPVDDDGNNTKTGDYKNISSYPPEVQYWITYYRDPWYFDGGVCMDYNRDRDVYRDRDEDNKWKNLYFPITIESDIGVIPTFPDGTMFVTGQPPPPDSPSPDIKYKSLHSVALIEISGETTKFGTTHKTYHYDIRAPRMFVPVERTMVTGRDNFIDYRYTVASQYCFVSTHPVDDIIDNDYYWDNRKRESRIHCLVQDKDTKETKIGTTKITWKGETQARASMMMASSGYEVLLSRSSSGMGNKNYQEVVAITPTTMSTKSIYHYTKVNDRDRYSGRDEGERADTSCVQRHVMTFSVVTSIIVLLLCAAWLILREGIPGGAVPFVFAIVATVYALLRNIAIFGFLIVGTVAFNVILSCGPTSGNSGSQDQQQPPAGTSTGNRGCCRCLPTWITREMYVWGFYSWLLAFIIMDPFAGFYGISSIWATVFMAFSGIIQDHPVLPFMGCVGVFIGLSCFVLFPFVGYFPDNLIIGTLSLLMGLGVIGLGNCISNNRKFVSGYCCRPILRCCKRRCCGSWASPAHGALPVPTQEI